MRHADTDVRSVHALRERLAPFRRASLTRALARTTVSWAVYAGAFALAVTSPHLLVRVLAGLVAGLFSGNLFMMGHDACHGSFTPSSTWNHLLGRIAFLPSYHPYSVWDLSHNRTHHIYTNLRGRDFVWAPVDKSEYDGMSRLGRALYRVYRTPLGMALYYPLEVWRTRLFFPARARLDRPRAVYSADCVLVSVFMIAQIAVAGIAAGLPARFDAGALLAGLTCGVLVPWLVFGWLIGFVVYFNHTHPRVVWYGRRDQWSFAEGNLRGTVHLRFPHWTRHFASNIMAHLAHHIDPRIPLPRLKAAQEHLEAHLPDELIVQPWRVSELLRILRVCRLYDFDARRWMDYDGAPTTETPRIGSTQREAT